MLGGNVLHLLKAPPLFSALNLDDFLNGCLCSLSVPAGHDDPRSPPGQVHGCGFTNASVCSWVRRTQERGQSDQWNHLLQDFHPLFKKLPVCFQRNRIISDIWHQWCSVSTWYAAICRITSRKGPKLPYNHALKKCTDTFQYDCFDTSLSHSKMSLKWCFVFWWVFESISHCFSTSENVFVFSYHFLHQIAETLPLYVC